MAAALDLINNKSSNKGLTLTLSETGVGERIQVAKLSYSLKFRNGRYEIEGWFPWQVKVFIEKGKPKFKPTLIGTINEGSFYDYTGKKLF